MKDFIFAHPARPCCPVCKRGGMNLLCQWRKRNTFPTLSSEEHVLQKSLPVKFTFKGRDVAGWYLHHIPSAKRCHCHLCIKDALWITLRQIDMCLIFRENWFTVFSPSSQSVGSNCHIWSQKLTAYFICYNRLKHVHSHTTYKICFLSIKDPQGGHP